MCMHSTVALEFSDVHMILASDLAKIFERFPEEKALFEKVAAAREEAFKKTFRTVSNTVMAATADPNRSMRRRTTIADVIPFRDRDDAFSSLWQSWEASVLPSTDQELVRQVVEAFLTSAPSMRELFADEKAPLKASPDRRRFPSRRNAPDGGGTKTDYWSDDADNLEHRLDAMYHLYSRQGGSGSLAKHTSPKQPTRTRASTYGADEGIASSSLFSRLAYPGAQGEKKEKSDADTLSGKSDG